MEFMHGSIGSEFASERPKPIGPAMIGEIVGYVELELEQPREYLSARRWHVLKVWSGQEQRVADEIEKIGMAAYIPMEPVQRQRRGRVERGSCPTYRGYLFAAFDPRGALWGRLPDIAGRSGMSIRLLKIDGRPASIAESAISRIREIEKSRMGGEEIAPMPVKIGNIVRIMEFYPFTGLFAPIIAVNEERRLVQIAFDFVGGTCKPWLDLTNIEVQ